MVVPDLSPDPKKQDIILLSTAISNGDDLAPFVRTFSPSKDSEIQDLCRSHFHDFIAAVDNLCSLLSAVNSLKTSISDSDHVLQSVAGPLLSSLDAYIEARRISSNLSAALSSTRLCIRALSLYSKANSHLSSGNLYPALRAIDELERDLLHLIPSSTLQRMLHLRIPAIHAYSERAATRAFSD